MYSIEKHGVLKQVESWCVTLPLHDNDGKPFSKETIDGVLEEITNAFPGFTVVNCVGYWKGTDQVYIDQNFQIIIDTLPEGVRTQKFIHQLRERLKISLRQEKIYITMQDAKKEFISFKEFFEELGIESAPTQADEAKNLAEQLLKSFEVVRQRLGYETTALRRDRPRGKIVWERRLGGIPLRSEIEDSIPEHVKLVAADQIEDIAALFGSDVPFAIIGGYEYQFHILDQVAYQPLVEVAVQHLNIPEGFYYTSPAGERLDTERFIEEFTASVITNVVVLRDEGYLLEELKINVGSDGSMQHAEREGASMLFFCPARISDPAVQKEIIRCLGNALEMLEAGSLNPLALLQAKAKNNYLVKRAMTRKTLRGLL